MSEENTQAVEETVEETRLPKWAITPRVKNGTVVATSQGWVHKRKGKRDEVLVSVKDLDKKIKQFYDVADEVVEETTETPEPEKTEDKVEVTEEDIVKQEEAEAAEAEKAEQEEVLAEEAKKEEKPATKKRGRKKKADSKK